MMSTSGRCFFHYQKMWFCGLLVLLSLFMGVASAMEPDNVILIYTGYYSLGSTGLPEAAGAQGASLKDGGEWLPIHFRPYVTHLNADNQPDDTFFDTFLFLGLRTARGRGFSGEKEQSKAALWSDWRWYIDRIYEPGKQMDALNTAVAEAEKQLGKPSQVDVYIMIPYPSYKVTDFGLENGSPGGDSLLPVENRLKYVRWYVDEVLTRWKQQNWPHLRLAGFYWVQEHFNPAVPGENELVTGAAAYVHAEGLKLGWIPWSGAFLATSWRKYDFDWAVTQPNHMFQSQPGFMEPAIQRAKQADMGLEIELDDRVLQPAGRKKLYDYLDAGAQSGLIHGLKAYYQDVFSLGKLYLAGGSAREMYDDVYAFAKGAYPNPTSNARWVHGNVTDPDGTPLADVQVALGGRSTSTDNDGRFNIFTYSSQSPLYMWKLGYGMRQFSFDIPEGQELSAMQVVLAPGEGRLIHGMDTTTGISSLGMRLTVSPDNKSEGDAALRVSATSGLNLLWLDSQALQGITNWESYQGLALDIYNEGPAVVEVAVNLTDASRSIYSRTFQIVPGAWQMLCISLHDAGTGFNHSEATVGRSSSGVDYTAIDRVGITIKASNSSTIFLDNLRLVGPQQR